VILSAFPLSPGGYTEVRMIILLFFAIFYFGLGVYLFRREAA
jgi:hypothetical protein